MVKTAKTAKRGLAKSRRKTGKSPRRSFAASVATSHPAIADAKRAAVVACVNAFMDQNRPGWNADLQGDGRKMAQDYHFPQQSIPPMLNAIRDCLIAKHYTFTITNDLVQKCAAGTLGDLKFEVYSATTLS